jgi:hypothetical protein
MKQFLFIFLSTLITNYVSAQGVDTYGRVTTNMASFINKYGVIGSSTAVNRFGGPVLLLNLTTTPASAITSTAAISGGNVTTFGGVSVSARGVCWSTSPTPTTANSKFTNTDATATFISLISGLSAGTAYYVRSFATNSAGTTYGNEISFVTAVEPNLPMPNLGLAGNFGILSKSGITDVYKSTITGDVGTSPIAGTALLLACDEVAGTIYTVNDAGPACRVVNPSMLTTAILDMEAAYTDLAGRSNPNFVELHAGDLGGKTLLPGLYKWSSTVIIPLDLTISGGANDVWIFQIAGTLDMASAKKVILSGGAQAKNIFWVVAGAVNLVTYSHFEGTILGKTSISLQTGGTINGRLLAQTAVTLQMNTVTRP